jgi:hypothetical protein
LEHFQQQTLPIGDLDGDGADDMLYLEPSWIGSGDDRGRIDWLPSLAGYTGSYSVDDLALESLAYDGADYVYWGWDALIADLDGDGLDDALISYMGDPDAVASYPGYLWFLSDFAGSVGSLTGLLGSADATISGTQDFAQFGNQLYFGHDVDGDGSQDLFVQAIYGGSGYEGQIRWLDVDGVQDDGDDTDVTLVTFQGDEADNGDDTRGAAFGDFDGDGVSEMVVTQSAWLNDAGVYAGRVFIVDVD